MSQAVIEILESKLNGGDIDKKIEGLASLEADLKLPDAEVAEPEHLISLLKTPLKSQNAHLTTAVLGSLVHLFPLLLPARSLRSRATSVKSDPSTGDNPQDGTSSGSHGPPPTPSELESSQRVLLSAVNGLVPGVLERLGEGRDKSKELALASLVAAGRASAVIWEAQASQGGTGTPSLGSSASKGKEKETPLVAMDRLVKEGGVDSKNWKIREQCLNYLLALRTSHPRLLLRPLMPLLIPLLEDASTPVRDLARTTVITIFTHPSVSPKAKEELKKELTKFNVRSKIVDVVLSSVLGGHGRNASLGGGLQRADSAGTFSSSQSLNNGEDERGSDAHMSPPSRRTPGVDLPKDSNRPQSRTASAMSGARANRNTSPAKGDQAINSNAGVDLGASVGGKSASVDQIEPVYVASDHDLEHTINSMLPCFEGKESEANWQDRDRSIASLRGLLKGEAHLKFPDTFIASAKTIVDGILKALASLRTTVATATCSLITELALALNSSIDPILEPLLSALLRMAGFTKKIVAQASQTAATELLAHAPYHTRTLNLLSNGMNEKTVQGRTYIIAHLKTFIEVNGRRFAGAIESSGLDLLETALKKGLLDVNPAVRETTRSVFWQAHDIWPNMTNKIISSLEPTAKKQLERSNPSKAASVPSPAPAKRPSVRAMIASRQASAPVKPPSPPRENQASALRKASAPGGRTTARHTPASSVSSVGRSPIRPPSPPKPATPPKSKSRPVSMYSTPSPPASPTPTSPTRPRSLSNTSHTRVTSPPSRPSPLRGQANLPPVRASPPLTPSRGPSKAFTPQGPSEPNPPVLNDKPSLQGKEDENPSQLGSHPDESIDLIRFDSPVKASVQSVDESGRPGHPIRSFLDTSIDDSIVEDALRAQAEQAESTAERFLELAEPHDGPSTTTLPLGPGGIALEAFHAERSATPASAITRAPLNRRVPSMETSEDGSKYPDKENVPIGSTSLPSSRWWVREAGHLPPSAPLPGNSAAQRQEAVEIVASLEQGSVDIDSLRKLSRLSVDRPIHDESLNGSGLRNGGSASATQGTNGFSDANEAENQAFWNQDKLFKRLYSALLVFLTRADADRQEPALVLLRDIVQNQFACFEGTEAELLLALFTLRADQPKKTAAAIESILILFVAQLEPVYGLTCVRSSLTDFVERSSDANQGLKEESAKSFIMGLRVFGVIFEQLPAEVLEEEVPKAKGLIKRALNDQQHADVRLAAVMCLVAVQRVLEDETHLFTMIDGLTKPQRQLLTYYIAKAET